MQRSMTLPLLLAGLSLASFLPGCRNDDSNPVNPPPAGTARVMVIHASPDAPGVDLYLDNVMVDSNLTFLENTGYLTVGAGFRLVKVTATGSTVPVIQGPVPVTAGTVYSVFAADSLVAITPVLLVDTLTTPPAGKVRLRFVHLSPNAPAVDVTTEGGTVVFGNRAFGEHTGFTLLDAGPHNLQLREAGTATVLIPLPTMTLAAGTIYTIYAKGFAEVTSGPQALGVEIIVNN